MAILHGKEPLSPAATSLPPPPVRLRKSSCREWKSERETWSDFRQDRVYSRGVGISCHSCVQMAKKPTKDGEWPLIGAEQTYVVSKGSWEV